MLYVIYLGKIYMENSSKLRREIIWFNKSIVIGRKEVCNKDWYKNGIVMLHDLLEEDGSFKLPHTLAAEIGVKIKAMEYNGLITAIPTWWKRAVKKMIIPTHAVSHNEQSFIKCNDRLMALGIVTNSNSPYLC